MADAAIFAECQSGQRWPVAMEGDYRSLESAYTKLRRSGEPVLASVEGKVGLRPKVDSSTTTPTLLVDRFDGLFPGETCGSPFATESLQEMYWKLTRVENQPVMVGPGQREPHLIFRKEKNQLSGFSGCNNMSGTYKLNGDELTFRPIAATRMACLKGGETESALFKALDRVRRWKILGQHLELYDAGGALLARFEARALR
jgi:copper homeostasis protein (lipoprotein)